MIKLGGNFFFKKKLLTVNAAFTLKQMVLNLWGDSKRFLKRNGQDSTADPCSGPWLHQLKKAANLCDSDALHF